MRFRSNREKWVIIHELAFEERVSMVIDDWGSIDRPVKQTMLLEALKAGHYVPMRDVSREERGEKLPFFHL